MEFKEKVVDRLNVMHAMFAAFIKSSDKVKDLALLNGDNPQLERYYTHSAELVHVYKARMTKNKRLCVVCSHKSCTFRMCFSAESITG